MRKPIIPCPEGKWLIGPARGIKVFGGCREGKLGGIARDIPFT